MKLPHTIVFHGVVPLYQGMDAEHRCGLRAGAARIS